MYKHSATAQTGFLSQIFCPSVCARLVLVHLPLPNCMLVFSQFISACRRLHFTLASSLELVSCSTSSFGGCTHPEPSPSPPCWSCCACGSESPSLSLLPASTLASGNSLTSTLSEPIRYQDRSLNKCGTFTPSLRESLCPVIDIPQIPSSLLAVNRDCITCNYSFRQCNGRCKGAEQGLLHSCPLFYPESVVLSLSVVALPCMMCSCSHLHMYLELVVRFSSMAIILFDHY